MSSSIVALCTSTFVLLFPLTTVLAGSTVTVQVSGIESATGEIHISLHNRSSFPKEAPLRSRRLPAAPSGVRWLIENLEPGEYAITAHHDTNGNGKLDRSALGPPTEPVAFSNRARANFGPPSFEDAKIIVREGRYDCEVVFAARGRWSAGVTMITGTRAYRGVSGRFLAVPLVGYESERISWRGPFLEVRPYATDKSSISLHLRTRFDGYDSGDSSRLQGMDDRDRTIDAGIGVRYQLAPDWQLELRALGDILGKHRGQNLEVTVSRKYGRGQWSWTPSLGLTLLSRRTADYYYGVRPTEARADRPAYESDGAFNWTGSLGFSFRSQASWMLFGTLTVEVLDSEINDSPIVRRDTLLGLVVGVVYLF